MIEKIVDISNFYLAWAKLKKAFKPGDIWFDEIELVQFESNIENEFKSIKKEILDGTYKISLISPVAYPKAKKDETLQTRQTFWLEIRDQLTWLAVVNVIGPELDHKMPFWSFGNRLYRSVWYESDSGNEKLKFGWYRHSSGFIFRKWNQSWPRYRRAISITTRVMAHSQLFKTDLEKFKKEVINDIQENKELEQNIDLPQELQIKYWDKEFWENKLSDSIHWASIDLEKFYPSIQVESVIENFKKYYPQDKQSPALINLITSLLNFHINTEGWSKNDLAEIGLDQGTSYNNIPTGLLVAGFLANLSMLGIDNEVNSEIEQRKNIAHFRFVDDHVILSDDFDSLVKWISDYKAILEKHNTGARFNTNKIEPISLKLFFDSKTVTEEKYKTAKLDTLLDPFYPSPLMTQTLAKVSNISKTEFDLLDDDEEDKLIADLQHLLISDFPDHELRKDTRISFAATILSRIVPRKIEDVTVIYKITKKIHEIDNQLKGLTKIVIDLNANSAKFIDAKNQISKLIDEKEEYNESIKNELYLKSSEQNTLRKHVFKLLLKSVRDNHQKVRLWTRLLEYNFNTGHKSLIEIFDTVNELENSEASKLSTDFIYSLILMILSNQIIDAALILTDNKSNTLKREFAEKFFLSCIDMELVEKIKTINTKSNKFYLTKTISFYKFAFGSSVFWIKNNNPDWFIRHELNSNKLIENFECINWEKDFDNWAKSNSYKIQNLAWWILNRTSNVLSSMPNIFWKTSIEKLPLEHKNSWAVIAMFPNHIPKKIIDVMEQYTDATTEYSSNQGWMYEVNISKKTNEIKINEVEYITLYDWTKWMKDKQNESLKNSLGIFDPRLSEWTALNIVYQIADILDNPTNPFFWYFDPNGKYSKVHPSNYLVPKAWTDNENFDWNKWQNKIKNKVILGEDDILIKDLRYTPDSNIFGNGEPNAVFGLGSILIGLLSKDYSLPFIWNINGLQQSNLFLAAKKIQKLSLSSFTYSIIESLFSLRNIDTKFIKSSQRELKEKSDFSDDTITDMPIIDNFKKLKEQLIQSMKILEKYQISVQDNLPRQLIPINLKQYSRRNNKLSESTEENPIE